MKAFGKSHIFGFMLFCIMLTACERRPLEEGFYTKALIPIKAYWDIANIEPRNATVLVYNTDGTLYMEKSFSSEKEYAYYELLFDPGTYTVIVFNEQRNEIENVKIRNHEKLSTLEAYITPANRVYRSASRAEGDQMVPQPGMLAVSKVENFTVTPEMVARSHFFKSQAGSLAEAYSRAGEPTMSSTDDPIYRLINLHPLPKVSRVSISAHIQGLKYAYMPALVELRNMAEGYLFDKDENTRVPVTTQFLMNNRVYDPGSVVDGSISGSVFTFGVQGDRTTTQDTPGKRVLVDMTFKLVDNATEERRSNDVTDLLEIHADESTISINIAIEVEQLPEVSPVGGGSGMNSDVTDWEGEIVTIPL